VPFAGNAYEDSAKLEDGVQIIRSIQVITVLVPAYTSSHCIYLVNNVFNSWEAKSWPELR
jgi:hypothetical protein